MNRNLLVLVLIAASFSSVSSLFDTIKQLRNVQVTVDNDDDRECSNQLKTFTDSLEKGEIWAVEMFDTWAKIPSGILQGFNKNIGFYTACVNFRHNLENAKTIQGQHCQVTLSSWQNSSSSVSDLVLNWSEVGKLMARHQLTLQQGICLPAVCSISKVKEITNQLLSPNKLKPVQTTCTTNDAVKFTAIDIIAIIIFTFFGVLLLSSTIYDVLMRRKEQEPHKLFVAFSVYTNGEKLFDITKPKSRNSIDCLNGLRAISLMFIIFGHRIFWQYGTWRTNGLEFDRTFEKPISALLISFHIWVDTFFVMGGLLVTTSFLNSLDKKTVNIPRMYLHRYLRYTPVVAALILFTVSLMKFMGDGPEFIFENMEPHCRTNWYWALLHIQNYVVPNHQCLDFTWYLSVDFQLFILSPILIYPLWKFGWRKVIWVFPVLIILSQGCIFASSYRNELTVFVGRLTPYAKDLYDKLIYYPTHTRYGPWLLGMIVGYVLHITRDKRIKINPILNASLWILSISLMITIIFGYFPFQIVIDNQTTNAGNALYNATFRVGWGLAISWIIFACQNGTGGIIRWFLSLRHWQPIGRMGLSIYLVHRVYDNAVIFRQKQTMYFDSATVFQIYSGELLITVGLASVLYLTFETPFLLVENYFYNQRKAKAEIKTDK